MKATTREDLNLKEDETMCEKCVHENICRREQCGEPFCVIRSCFDFEEKRLRGEWKNGVCTNCGAECFEDYYMRDIKTEFCHRCGADMRGTEK